MYMYVKTYQYSQICLRCPTNHVWYKAFVARSIQDSEVPVFCFKKGPANLYCLSLFSLLQVCV